MLIVYRFINTQVKIQLTIKRVDIDRERQTDTEVTETLTDITLNYWICQKVNPLCCVDC